jgi:hypothetical protein
MGGVYVLLATTWRLGRGSASEHVWARQRTRGELSDRRACYGGSYPLLLEQYNTANPEKE